MVTHQLAVMSDDSEIPYGAEALADEAKLLIQRAFRKYNAQYGLSTTSVQVYDTAWVSMVTKTIDGKKQWLFPESFHFLLKTQSEDGSWGLHPTTQTAGILDTAAALLALYRHAAAPLQIHEVSPKEITLRIDRATESLRTQLRQWTDVFATNHIGVELIVPALLEYLRLEDTALCFEFQSKKTIMDMNAAKLSVFKLESLYGNIPSSAIHSLEAFIGKIDFDRVAHHIFQGSMLASPSSTAAYLIHASNWDDEAEGYLRHVLEAGSGCGDGGIPGTFPTTFFEYSWTLATLFRAGFKASELECPELHGIAEILVNGFQADRGVLGFAPRAVDVDDTAKGLLALRAIGYAQKVSPRPMIKVFERAEHFTTFGSERDPSFTSNCHVLLALLAQEDVLLYSSQINKTINFLCETWWNTDHSIKDKWHLSHLYPTMLMVEAFADLLHLLDRGILTDTISEKLIWKVTICLFQACQRTLLEQREDGSWNAMREQTAYAILALAEARRICFFSPIQPNVQDAIDRGVSFLKSSDLTSWDQNWTSKTAYRVTFVAEAYVLAASKARSTCDVVADVGVSLGRGLSTPKIDGLLQLASLTPHFSSLPEWQVRASLLESALFVPLLKAQRLEIFPRDDFPLAKDSYLNIIPFTWVGCSNRDRTFVSTSFLYDMMLLSLLGFQTDEFIESIASPAFAGNTAELHKLIDRIIYNTRGNHKSNSFGHGPNSNETNGHSANGNSYTIGMTTEQLSLQSDKISGPLSCFVTHVLCHPSILGASSWDRQNLQYELAAFLHAHTTQMEDNRLFGLQSTNKDIYASAGRSFFQWVRTTAADHVACAYSMKFAICLISSSLADGNEVFPTVAEKYLAAATTRHLATKNRMYNDYGSLVRDTIEMNVNSMHFPEFSLAADAEAESIAVKKRSLANLAEYESMCVKLSLAELEQEVIRTQSTSMVKAFGSRKLEIVKFFGDVAGFYDQLYVVRDLSSNIYK